MYQENDKVKVKTYHGTSYGIIKKIHKNYAWCNDLRFEIVGYLKEYPLHSIMRIESIISKI